MSDVTFFLLAQWREGDQCAARELFERYAGRMIELARSRLSSTLARRIDPEDVVQSACRSFFAGAREGRYQLERGGDLWQLMAAVTLHKLRDQARKHTADKRSVKAERNSLADMELFAREPSPLEAVALVDEVTHLMRGLTPAQRHMAELRLQGYNLDEIAAEAQCSLQSVRRLLDKIKDRLILSIANGTEQ